VEQGLFLLDKFCVGNEVYHELSMITKGLPKSYLVKQSRTAMNKLYHIERTCTKDQLHLVMLVSGAKFTKMSGGQKQVYPPLRGGTNEAHSLEIKTLCSS